MSIKYKYKLPEIIAALLILLFCYTGISKLIDHESFKAIIGKSPLIGKAGGIVSWVLPITEIAICTFLLIPSLRQTGLLLSMHLMVLFTFYIVYMLVFAASLPCSCGGVLKNLSWPAHLVFNICFAVLATIAWFLEKNNKRIIAINTRFRRSLSGTTG